MQSFDPALITFPYTEVPIPNKSYSKLVLADGRVGVLLTTNNGCNWSTMGYFSHQLLFDSRIVKFVLSNEFMTHFNHGGKITDKATDMYKKFMDEIIIRDISDTFHNMPDVSDFANLTVEFIPQNLLFRIKEVDGIESIEIFNPRDYYFS